MRVKILTILGASILILTAVGFTYSTMNLKPYQIIKQRILKNLTRYIVVK